MFSWWWTFYLSECSPAVAHARRHELTIILHFYWNTLSRIKFSVLVDLAKDAMNRIDHANQAFTDRSKTAALRLKLFFPVPRWFLRCISSCCIFCASLRKTRLCLASHERDIGKQCRPRSDAAERGVWSGSTLFALTTGISIKHITNQNWPDTS